MQTITTLTDYPDQKHRLVLENNDTVDFRLYYSIRQQSWYYDFSYKNITVNCSKVVLTPNSIRNLKRILPFGLAFYSESSVEPFRIDDFSTGRVKLGILSADEVKEVEAEIYNL